MIFFTPANIFSRCDSDRQAFDQRCIVERFAQESNRSASNRTIAAALIRMGCNQNYRRAMTLRPQRLLQFKAA